MLHYRTPHHHFIFDYPNHHFRSVQFPSSIIFTFLFILVVIQADAQNGVNDSCETQPNVSSLPLEKIAAEFRTLRKLKSHFNGGTWNNDADRWNGRKHRLMIEMKARLFKNHNRKSDVIRLLDSPDRITRKGDTLFHRLIDTTRNDTSPLIPDELLIYYWRGEHDFMFFSCKDSTIQNCRWWHAWE